MRLVTIALLVGLLVPAAAAGDANVPLRPQQTSSWCWAAAAQMAMEALHPPSVTQVTQAGHRYPPANECFSFHCGGGNVSRRCNKGGFPEFAAFGFEVEETTDRAPLSWEALACELDAGRPVVFLHEDRPNGVFGFTGHAWVAKSAYPGADQRLAVNDPGPPCKGNDSLVMTYQEYRGRGGRGHWIDYYKLRPRGQQPAPCRPRLAPESPWMEPESESAEKATAAALVPPFLTRVQGDAWYREHARLAGSAELSCDTDRGIVEEVISVEALRAASAEDFDDVVEDAGRIRYLCLNGQQSFSVEVALAMSNRWQITTLGSVDLAADVHAAIGNTDRRNVREVYVQGLNVRFLRFLGDSPDRIVPLSDNRDLGIPLGPQAEGPFLDLLKEAARSFVFAGPDAAGEATTARPSRYPKALTQRPEEGEMRGTAVAVTITVMVLCASAAAGAVGPTTCAQLAKQFEKIVAADGGLGGEVEALGEEVHPVGVAEARAEVT